MTTKQTLRNKLVAEKQRYNLRNQRDFSTPHALRLLQLILSEEVSSSDQTLLLTNIEGQEDLSLLGSSDKEILFAKFWNVCYEVLGDERAEGIRKKYNHSMRNQ